MSHWGAFAADVDASGEVTAVRPDALDPAPSPLLGNFVGALRHPLRVATPMVRRGWLERGPGPDVARGTDEFVAVGWDEVLDRLAAELTRVYDGPGPEAVFGGSYGWASAGRFHHAQSQVHRFLNCLGGYVRSVNTYSIGTSEVVLPRIFGRRGDLLRSFTAWPLIAAHTELLVCFGGIPAKNLAVAPGGVTRHRSVGHLTEMVRRGGEVVLAGPDRADHARRAPGPVAAAAARHRRRADAGAVPGAGRRGPARRRLPRDALRGRRRGARLPRRQHRRRREVAAVGGGRSAACPRTRSSRWPARWRPGTRWSR